MHHSFSFCIIILYSCRPMYVDSSSISPPVGDQSVASDLRKYVEPLLKVIVLCNVLYIKCVSKSLCTYLKYIHVF